MGIVRSTSEFCTRNAVSVFFVTLACLGTGCNRGSRNMIPPPDSGSSDMVVAADAIVSADGATTDTGSGVSSCLTQCERNDTACDAPMNCAVWCAAHDELMEASGCTPQIEEVRTCYAALSDPEYCGSAPVCVVEADAFGVCLDAFCGGSAPPAECDLPAG